MYDAAEYEPDDEPGSEVPEIDPRVREVFLEALDGVPAEYYPEPPDQEARRALRETALAARLGFPLDELRRVLDYMMPGEHADYERTRARAEHATETRSQMQLPPVPHPELDNHIWHDLQRLHHFLAVDQTPGGLTHPWSKAGQS